jgi:hypothetical protein
MQFWLSTVLWIVFCVIGLARDSSVENKNFNLSQAKPLEHVKLLKTISVKNPISPELCGRIQVATVSRSVNLVAFCRGVRKIFIQEVQTGNTIAQFDAPEGFETIIFDPSGKFLIVTGATYSKMVIEKYVETTFLGVYDIYSKKWRSKNQNLPVENLYFDSLGHNLIAIGDLKIDRVKKSVYLFNYFDGVYKKVSSKLFDLTLEKSIVLFSRYILNDKENLLVYKYKTCSEKPDSINAYILSYKMNHEIKSKELPNLKNCDYLNYVFANQDLLIENLETISAYDQKGNTIWSQEKTSSAIRVSPRGDVIALLLSQASATANLAKTRLIFLSTKTGKLIGSITDFPSDLRWYEISSDGKFVSALVDGNSTIQIWGTPDHQPVFRAP